MSNKVFVFILLVFYVGVSAQSIQEIICDHKLDDCKYVQVDDDRYYLIQSSTPVDGSSNGPGQLSISLYNECGLLSTHSYMHEYVERILDIKSSWLDDDTLRIALFVNPRVVHGRREMGLLSVNTFNFDNTYKYLREDGGGVYFLSMVPTKDDKFAVWVFFSNVYKPSVYGAFILSKNFEIEHQYINFQEGTITGSLVQTPSGYMANSASTLIHFDSELNPMWTKRFENRHFLQKKIVVDDGIVMLRSHIPFQMPRQRNVLKINFEGEVMWESNDILSSEEGFSRANLIQRPDGNFSAVTFRYEDEYSDTLYHYVIDGSTGSILSTQMTKEANTISDFRFLDLANDINGDDLLVLRGEQSQHLLWPLSDDSDCVLRDTTFELREIPALSLEDLPFEQSLIDFFETGSYVWEANDISLNSRLLCEKEILYFDLLPEDTIACIEEPYYIDLGFINRDIIWEDGSTDKVRLISKEGAYRYEVDHCSTDQSEEVNVTFKSCICELILPNVISRSSQSENSVFSLSNQCPDLQTFSLHVMDRWGGLVYETQDSDFVWDGTKGSSDVEIGVYVYRITYQSKYTEEIVTITGDITIL
jgi:hypothetical protein